MRYPGAGNDGRPFVVVGSRRRAGYPVCSVPGGAPGGSTMTALGYILAGTLVCGVAAALSFAAYEIFFDGGK